MGDFHQSYLRGNVVIVISDFISYSNDLRGRNRHINFTVNIAQKAWRLRKAGKSSMVGKRMDDLLLYIIRSTSQSRFLVHQY